MSRGLDSPTQGFVERRVFDVSQRTPEVERRQFANTLDGLSPEAQELGHAIDEYKLRHRRRFITYDETLSVIQSLGYHR